MVGVLSVVICSSRGLIEVSSTHTGGKWITVKTKVAADLKIGTRSVDLSYHAQSHQVTVGTLYLIMFIIKLAFPSFTLVVLTTILIC